LLLPDEVAEQVYFFFLFLLLMKIIDLFFLLFSFFPTNKEQEAPLFFPFSLSAAEEKLHLSSLPPPSSSFGKRAE